MKSYVFTGKYKKNNEAESFFTNTNFITETVVPILKKLQNNKKLDKHLYFLDTSCGDNRLTNTLLKEGIINNVVSYDLFFESEKSFKKDWLREKFDNKNQIQKQINCVGFNPPYGFNGKVAKKFITKAYEEKYTYAIWLVPISLQKVLNTMYTPIYQERFIDVVFENNKEKTHVKHIKHSVVLFIGKRLDSPIILSPTKNKNLHLGNIIITRKHYAGISDNVDVIVKKTGNPVLLPFFIRKDVNTWIQYGKDGVVTENSKLIKKEKGDYMRGISKTKHTEKEYDYSVDSNVYFKLENVKKTINIELFVNKLINTSKEKWFYELTNQYKPASITKGWFEKYVFDFITENK